MNNKYQEFILEELLHFEKTGESYSYEETFEHLSTPKLS